MIEEEKKLFEQRLARLDTVIGRVAESRRRQDQVMDNVVVSLRSIHGELATVIGRVAESRRRQDQVMDSVVVSLRSIHGELATLLATSKPEEGSSTRAPDCDAGSDYEVPDHTNAVDILTPIFEECPEAARVCERLADRDHQAEPSISQLRNDWLRAAHEAKEAEARLDNRLAALKKKPTNAPQAQEVSDG